MNSESTRRFDWDALPADVKRFGMTRGTLLAATFGASLWVVLLAVDMVARGRLDLSLLLALALPYAGVLFVLITKRGGVPQRVYAARVLLLCGAFLAYLSLLMRVSSKWQEALLGGAVGHGALGPGVLVGGAIMSGSGILLMMGHRRRRSEMPAAEVAIGRAERLQHFTDASG